MSSQITDIASIQQQINKIRNSANKKKIGQGAFGDIFVYENNQNGVTIGDKDKFIIKESKKPSHFKYHKNQIQMYNYLKIISTLSTILLSILLTKRILLWNIWI